MAKGNEIIVSAYPQGKFEEGTITDTSKPGTCMEIVPAVAPTGGRFSYRASSKAAGVQRQLCILLADSLQGKLPTDAYVAGTRCFLYFPATGEDINILMAGQPGTGSTNAFTIGELIAWNSTGKGIANSGYVQPALTCQEHIDEVINTDTLVWCKVNAG